MNYQFYRTPLFAIFIHVVLIISIFIASNQIILYSKKMAELNLAIQSIEDKETVLRQVQDTNGYYTSNAFAEKYAKQTQRKKIKGEFFVPLPEINTDDSDHSYIPKVTKDKDLSNWLECILKAEC